MLAADLPFRRAPGPIHRYDGDTAFLDAAREALATGATPRTDGVLLVTVVVAVVLGPGGVRRAARPPDTR
ncbi:hypothetical protein [Nocardia sp. NPDC051750]|uniref:hypothetical protein n=1 Tax=Nocardia sp. NPDC051750 TaxID=3364325 RepID=UPI00379A8963